MIIIGGAITGACTALHLLRMEPALRVAIVEKDPTYRTAPTSLSTAGVRILFSQPESILMSQYGHEFFEQFDQFAGIADNRPSVAFKREGYLFIANDDDQARDMEANHRLQLSLHCHVELLDAQAVKTRFPAYATEDIICAAYAPHDGWIDPHAAMQGLLKKIAVLGCDYISACVVDIAKTPTRVTGVVLEGGRIIECDSLVNATGAWSSELSQKIGMTLPVHPLPRMVYFFDAEQQFGALPLTLDGHGAFFRPEGRGFLSGVTDYDAVGRFCFVVDYDYFDTVVWPRLMNRVPTFAAIKLRSAWVGHYDQNTFDGNVIVGPWKAGTANYYVAAGSSGHGLQHAPALGRGLAELILRGRFETIDLSRLDYQRVIDGDPYPERGAKA